VRRLGLVLVRIPAYANGLRRMSFGMADHELVASVQTSLSRADLHRAREDFHRFAEFWVRFGGMEA
jgi:hypothetical protein